MPLLGAHMSIAGGLYRAFDRLREVRGSALQVFVKNERQWQAKPLEEGAVEAFRASLRESGPIPVAAHDSYLINLAATDPVILEKSVAAFAEELRRCQILGIPYLITHPGAHLGQGVETGSRRFALNLDRAIDLSEAHGVTVLIENTAGQGTCLGSRFEEIALILEHARHGDDMGVCFDTCHAFAAGYDIQTREGYGDVFRGFDSILGIDRLKFFHLNDSKKGLGSRVDRHEHIGKGRLGLEAFRLLLNDPRFARHPMVIETPKENGLERDRENLTLLRSLMEKAG